MSVKLIRITPDYARVIEYASRQSTHSKCREGESEDFVRRIVKRKHLSLGRFVNVEFEVTSSRCSLQQWARHKFLEFCVQSQRYVNQKDNKFILPELNYINEENRKIILQKMRAEVLRSKEVYVELLELGVKKEDARYCLPEAIQTQFSVISNLQGWTNFLLLRLDKHAQTEIRKSAEEIKVILLKECPAWFEEIFREELL